MKEKLRKVLPCLCGGLALLTVLIVFICYLNDSRNQNIKVEQYCAKVNETSVQEYKGCIQLKPIEILDNLANNVKDLYDIPNLPEIKEN